MIFVIATVELEEGRRADFLAEFEKIVPLVREEKGCIEYGPTVDIETSIDAQGDPREDVVVIVEKWDSLDMLEDHLVAPHMMEYRPKVKHMIRNSNLQILQPATT